MSNVDHLFLAGSPGEESSPPVRGSEARFRFIADAAPLLVWMTDAEGHLTYVNRRWLEFTGHSLREQLAGGLYTGVHEDDRARCIPRFETALADRAHLSQEMRLRRVDGEYRRLFSTATPWFDESGTFQGYIGTCVEIITRSSGSHSAIQAARSDLVERMAGSVAHDFSNLLTAITCSAELLLAAAGPSDPNRADLETIRHASDRATALTRQLLAFSGKQVMRSELLDINDVIRDAEPSVRALLGNSIALTMELEHTLGRVRADRSQVAQVLRNLALNGRDAMPAGGVLTIRTINVQTIGDEFGPTPALEAGAYVRLTVGDTGTGMDDETRRRAVEPFFTTKARAEGRGLGLSTVYGVVQQFGGSIWIDSGPRQGTRVHVYLPLVEEESGEVARPRTSGALGTLDAVLLVEDEDVVRSISERILRTAGYAVLTAGDADEALKVWQNHAASIRLLVTDVVMPGMDGLELSTRIREARPDLPVLFVSGYTREATLPLDIQGPMTRFLQKPFTIDALKSTVEEMLGKPASGV